MRDELASIAHPSSVILHHSSFILIVNARTKPMDYKITGDVMQALQVTLRPGEELYAEAGSMLYMSSGIELQARMQGGVMKGLMRKFLAGESMFMSVFRCNGGEGRFYAVLTGPGHIVLQTLPFSRFANRVAAAIGSHRDESRGIAGLGGKILGNIISD